jgi:8-oxo-dGTP diphosphatase
MTLRPLHVVGAAVLRNGRCLATQRSAAMAAPLKWEFPGGKVEQDEDPRVALHRELLEELQVSVKVGPWIARGEAEAGGRLIHLDVYAGTVESGEVRLREHAQFGWFDVAELGALDWAAPDVPVLSSVVALLSAPALSPRRARRRPG